jgi:hypothetical protein
MDKFTDLLRLAAQLNSPHDYTVFIYFNGHVENIDVVVHPHGWESSADRKYTDRECFYFSETGRDSKTTEEAIAAACQWLRDHYESNNYQKAPA